MIDRVGGLRSAVQSHRQGGIGIPIIDHARARQRILADIAGHARPDRVTVGQRQAADTEIPHPVVAVRIVEQMRDGVLVALHLHGIAEMAPGDGFRSSPVDNAHGQAAATPEQVNILLGVDVVTTILRRQRFLSTAHRFAVEVESAIAPCRSRRDRFAPVRHGQLSAANETSDAGSPQSEDLAYPGRVEVVQTRLLDGDFGRRGPAIAPREPGFQARLLSRLAPCLLNLRPRSRGALEVGEGRIRGRPGPPASALPILRHDDGIGTVFESISVGFHLDQLVGMHLTDRDPGVAISIGAALS